MCTGVLEKWYESSSGHSRSRDRFWLEGGLRISPIEQVDFLARLYRGELPFSPRAHAAVKRIILVEQTPAYTLRAKTGLAARWAGG